MQWLGGGARTRASISTYFEIISMQITTMHTLSFTFRAPNGKHKLAEEIIKAGVVGASNEIVMISLVNTSTMPLPAGEDTAIRTTKMQVQSEDLDLLTLFWHRAQDALGLIGVEAVSP